MLLHFGKPGRKRTSFTQFSVHKVPQILSWHPLYFRNFLFYQLILHVGSIQFAQENIVNLVLSKTLFFCSKGFIQDFINKEELLIGEIYFELSIEGSVESGSDGFDLFLSGLEFDHVGMGAAGVGPGKGEGFFVWGAALKQELVFGVEEEYAECSVGHGVGFREVFVGVGSPLVKWAEELVSEWDGDELVEEDSVREVFGHEFNNIIRVRPDYIFELFRSWIYEECLSNSWRMISKII